MIEIVDWFEHALEWNMPGWCWRFEAWTDPAQFGHGQAGVLTLTAITVDTYGKVPGEIRVDHAFTVHETISVEDLPHFFRSCVRTALCHEGDEWIRVRGEMMFDPHVWIKKL